MLRGNCVLDIVEELRVRQWARRNWVPSDLRDARWHRVIHEEMTQRDAELAEGSAAANRTVPLAEPSSHLPAPHFLQTPTRRAEQELADEFEACELHYG